MKKNSIKVFVKNPGQAPHMEIISNTLESLQRIVGGYIETVTLSSNLVIIVNEEGAINGMPFNCTYCGAHLYGPIIWAGISRDEFSDVPFTTEGFKRVNSNLYEEAAR